MKVKEKHDRALVRLLEAEVRQTVASKDEVEAEIADLMKALETSG